MPSLSWIDTLRPADDAAEADLEPVSFARTLAEAKAVLGEVTTAWVVQRAKRITDEYVQTLPDEGRRPDVVDRRSCEASLLNVMAWLRSGRPLTDEIDEVVEGTRSAVRRGVRLDTSMRAIWFAHTAAQAALFEVIYRQVPPDELVGELRVVSDRMLSFVDGFTRAVVQIYDQERVSWEDRLTTSRRQALVHVLERGTAPADGEHLLGIRLTGFHLAAVVRLLTDDPAVHQQGDVTRYAAAVAGTVPAASSLVLPWPDGSTLMVWSFPALHSDPVEAILTHIPHPEHTAVALGPVGQDVRGLRDSILGARQAARLADSRSVAGTWAYDHVAHQALLLADVDAAGRFVRHVLAGLTAPDAKSAVLRETLCAYLRHGRSRLVAAQELHVAPNTVAYRVRQAEERLERPLPDDTTALVVALGLAHDVPALLDRGEPRGDGRQPIRRDSPPAHRGR